MRIFHSSPRVIMKINRITAFVLIFLLFTAFIPEQSNVQAAGNQTQANSENIRKFVTRLYIVCLSREPDSAGLAAWTKALESGALTGAEVVQGFVFSQEMSNKYLSEKRFVEILYNAMLGRAPDLGGKAAWLACIAGGMSLHRVFQGFSNSVEFTNICNKYGIASGGILTPREMPPPTVPAPQLVFNGQYNPLTGEPLYKDIAGNRPWSVAIGNTSGALPLLGIGQADIICEYPVESGETRFTAIYQDISDVDMIAGVRSLRTSSMEIAAGFDSIFAHWLGRTNDNIETTGNPVTKYDTINASSVGGRHPDRPGTHDAYVTGRKLISSLPSGFRIMREDKTTHPFLFTADGKPKGLPAQTVTVTFSENTRQPKIFTYDESNRQYNVTHIGRDLIDGLDGEKLAFTNILVIQTEMAFKINSAGHTYIKTTGSGEGYFICGGEYTEIYWVRDVTPAEAPFMFFLKDGTPLTLGIGKSFICFTHETQHPIFE